MKARKLTYKTMYEPEVKVCHSHNETFKQIYIRYYREEYAIKVLKKRNFRFGEFLEFLQ